MVLVGLCLAPLVLTTAGFVTLVGKGVVMVLLLDLVRVPLSFSWMSFWDTFATLLGLDVHYFLALFPFGIVLLDLPVRSLLGLCQCLVVLQVWCEQVLVRRLVMTTGWVVMRFTGLVALVLVGNEFDETEKPQHTSLGNLCNLGHVCGRNCIVLGILVIRMSILEGGVAIDMTRESVLFIPGLG